MFDEYSIERHVTDIHDQRTREYFSEVLSCYTAGNYRSSVVMLWSVAICDLLFKLRDLAELHGDAKAKRLLKELDQKRKEKGRQLSAWEMELVQLVVDRTQLLGIAEKKSAASTGATPSRCTSCDECRFSTTSP